MWTIASFSVYQVRNRDTDYDLSISRRLSRASGIPSCQDVHSSDVLGAQSAFLSDENHQHVLKAVSKYPHCHEGQKAVHVEEPDRSVNCQVSLRCFFVVEKAET